MLFKQRTSKGHGYSTVVKEFTIEEFTPAVVVADRAIKVEWTTEKHKMAICLYGEEIDLFFDAIKAIRKTTG